MPTVSLLADPQAHGIASNMGFPQTKLPAKVLLRTLSEVRCYYSKAVKSVFTSRKPTFLVQNGHSHTTLGVGEALRAGPRLGRAQRRLVTHWRKG